MIRLQPQKSFRYRGLFKYLASYDYSAGKKERYTLMVLNVDEPVIIGRELDLPTARGLIADYELLAEKYVCMYCGDRSDVIKVRNKVRSMRRKTKVF